MGSEDGVKGAAGAADVSSTPRRRGFVGHCVKFWWAYLLLLIIIIVIVVPVVLLVAVPKIAQEKLDEAELSIDGIRVTHTETNNMTMAINSTIRSDGKVHATIEPFEGMLYLEDRVPHTAFAKINFPETTSEALQTVNVSQFVNIEDVEALTIFNTWLLANDTLRVTVQGDTHVKVKGIARRYPVTFKKTLTMPGLQGLAGLTVTDADISLGPDARGNNYRGTVHIPNRSLVAFELGNATFYNYLLGEEVGTVYMDNLVLEQGDNVAPMRATIANDPILKALGSQPYCDETNGVLPFELRGKSVTNNKQPIPYFADALASHNQTIELDIGGTLTKSTNITIPCGGLPGLGGH